MQSVSLCLLVLPLVWFTLNKKECCITLMPQNQSIDILEICLLATVIQENMVWSTKIAKLLQKIKLNYTLGLLKLALNLKIIELWYFSMEMPVILDLDFQILSLLLRNVTQMLWFSLIEDMEIVKELHQKQVWSLMLMLLLNMLRVEKILTTKEFLFLEDL